MCHLCVCVAVHVFQGVYTHATCLLNRELLREVEAPVVGGGSSTAAQATYRAHDMKGVRIERAPRFSPDLPAIYMLFFLSIEIWNAKNKLGRYRCMQMEMPQKQRRPQTRYGIVFRSVGSIKCHLCAFSIEI